MSEFEPPAPGWWKASDGNWYAPETHPDYRPPPPMEPVPTQKKPVWRRGWMIALASVIGLVVIVGVAAGERAEDDDATGAATAASSIGDEPEDTDPSPVEVAAAETSRPDTSPADPSPPDPSPAASDEPLAYDALVPVVFSAFGDADGSAWNVRVSPPRDVTDEVLDQNPFNDPPPDGAAFVGFDVEMTLASAGKEPLSPGFNLTWEILGGASAGVYNATTLPDIVGCGVTPADFNDGSEAFVGGTLSGLVCIPLPAEDVAHPDTRVAMNFRGERVMFEAGGATAEPATVQVSAGPAAIGESLPMGAPVDVEWQAIGDADGSIWSTSLTGWRDLTAAVAAENQFNDPPPEGALFAAFDVEMTLLEAGKEPLSPGFNFSWEVLGGETKRVYKFGTFAPLAGCGVIPNDFNPFAEVFAGGTLAGAVCIPIPIADFDHPDTRIAMNFGGERITFDPNG